jgi:hypothetical protein
MAKLLWEVDDMAAISHGHPSPTESSSQQPKRWTNSRQYEFHDDHYRSEYAIEA